MTFSYIRMIRAYDPLTLTLHPISVSPIRKFCPGPTFLPDLTYIIKRT
jgi:hypothetical protein